MSKTAKTKGRGSGEQAVIAALGAQPEATVAEIATAAGMGRSTVSGLLVRLERRGEVSRQAGGRDGARRWPDRWSRATRRRQAAQAGSQKASPGRKKARVASDQTGARARRHASEERLPAGALDALVLEHMRAHDDGPRGPGMIGKAIGKSSGAVANCLVRLARDGQVRQVSGRPIRYRLSG